MNIHKRIGQERGEINIKLGVVVVGTHLLTNLPLLYNSPSYQLKKKCSVLNLEVKFCEKFSHSSVIFKFTFCFTSYSDPLIICFVFLFASSKINRSDAMWCFSFGLLAVQAAASSIRSNTKEQEDQMCAQQNWKKIKNKVSSINWGLSSRVHLLPCILLLPYEHPQYSMADSSRNIFKKYTLRWLLLYLPIDGS